MPSESKDSIFRKSSLERISSPEQLNEYIKIVNPSLIGILAALFLIMFGCGFWMFFGSIPKRLDIVGTAITEKNGVKKVFCYVPISKAKRLKVNMQAEVSPDYAPKEQYGYIEGKIIDIGENTVSESYIRQRFENPEILLPSIANTGENLIQLQVSLGGWSSERGESISVTDGSKCIVSVVESEQKPYQLIFNA